MVALKNEIGNKYGKLVVLSRICNASRTTWLCICECGNSTEVLGTSLRSGKTKSCGCARKDTNICGMRTHPIYNSYSGAKGRCNNKNDPAYKYYGGRGIKFLFKDSKEFIDLMLPTWKEGLSLDRIDVNGHYEVSNCRWVTPQAQQLNKSNNIFITMHNKNRITLKEVSILYSIYYETLRYRYKVCGDNFKELLRPVRGRSLYDPITLDPINVTT